MIKKSFRYHETYSWGLNWLLIGVPVKSAPKPVKTTCHTKAFSRPLPSPPLLPGWRAGPGLTISWSSLSREFTLWLQGSEYRLHTGGLSFSIGFCFFGVDRKSDSELPRCQDGPEGRQRDNLDQDKEKLEELEFLLLVGRWVDLRECNWTERLGRKETQRDHESLEHSNTFVRKLKSIFMLNAWLCDSWVKLSLITLSNCCTCYGDFENQ